MIKRTSGKIKSHYGMKDYYRHYKKNSDNPVDYTTYSEIISKYNRGIIDLMLNKSLEYRMPIINFLFTIRKDQRKPQIKDGVLYNNRPIDFKRTMELWAIDEEAKKNKVLLRFNNNHTSGYVFRIYCKKLESGVKNKKYYKFAPSREFKRALAARINDEDKPKFDCYLLYEK